MMRMFECLLWSKASFSEANLENVALFLGDEPFRSHKKPKQSLKDDEGFQFFQRRKVN